MEQYTNQIIATLLLTLRFAPTFAFAPPFTLLRVPVSIRLILSLSLAAWLNFSFADQTYNQEFMQTGLAQLVAGELFLGVVLALSLQLAYAAILTAGRTIDVQAGFGLALLIDPTTRAQTPLVGTIFAYAAGAVFFSLDGAFELVAITATSLETMPLGQVIVAPDIAALLQYISTVFIIAFGLAGIVLLSLFLVDLTVAFMSRTLPQMNVLLLGFQIKTLAVLLTLPITIAVSGSIFLRIVRTAINGSVTFLQ